MTTSKPSWGTITVEGRDTGPISWSDGRFGGDDQLVQHAEMLCALHQRVGLTPVGPYHDASAALDGDPIAAIAVMRAVTAGGGTVEWDSPQERSDEVGRLLRTALYGDLTDDELANTAF